MNSALDLESMQGWLLKEKSKQSKFNVFGNEDKRWFRVQNLAAEGSRYEELALVYYQTDKSKDPKGWIFLKDINEITEDGEAFKIASYARTMVLQAGTRAEHRFWVTNLVKMSENSQYRGSTISASDYDAICSSRRRGSDDGKEDGGDLLKLSVKRSDGAELSAPPSPKAKREKPPLVLRKDSRDREDHRMDDYPRGGGAPSQSSRLHDQIAGGSPRRGGTRSRSPANRSNGSAGSDRGGDLRAESGGHADSDSEAQGGTLYDGEYGSHGGRRAAPPGGPDFDDEEELPAGSGAKGEGPPRRGRSRSPREDSPPRSRSPPPAEHKRKAPPMPAGPAPSMPRKARDVLAAALTEGESAAVPRRSIDALISEDKRIDAKSDASDDDNDLRTDFIKEERRRYGSGAASALDAAESKDGGLPPRAPRSPREPIAHAESLSNSASRSGRSSTPPRRGADPGSTVDANFVADNWDDDDDAPVVSKVNRNSKAGQNRTTHVSVGSTVKADENWLDEDFDDD